MVQLKLTLWISDIEYNWDFNSMMVQLKLIEKVNPSHPDKDFNSIMVQLKHAEAELDAANVRFQFHNGTIKTMQSSSTHFQTTYFNSIMVQLKLVCVWKVKQHCRISIP